MLCLPRSVHCIFIHLCTGKKFKPNDVILTTALGGRGTDFAVNDEVHASGGLFVLLSHLAPNRYFNMFTSNCYCCTFVQAFLRQFKCKSWLLV